MNWTQFLGGLAALYLFYYLLNVLFDLFRAGRQTTPEGAAPELVLSEDAAPVPVGAEAPVPMPEKPAVQPKPRQVLSSGPLQSTGAVSIREMFALVQADKIKLTASIPY